MGILDKMEEAKPREKTEVSPPNKNPSSSFGLTNTSIPAIDSVNNNDTSRLKKVKVREISPARCRPWKYHDRDEQWWLTQERSQGLIDAIREEGQKQFGLVRPLQNDPDHDYEIIYGLRRWFACKFLNIPFTAEITTEDDKACSQYMRNENEQSKDISDLERCFALADQLGTIYKERQEMAKDHGISPSLVTRRLNAAKVRDYPWLMTLLQPIIVGVSVRQASDLIDAISSSKASLNEIKHNAAALHPHSGRFQGNVGDVITECRAEAVTLTSKLLKPHTLPRNVKTTTEVNTYLKDRKDKEVITLTDNKKGKVSVIINTKLLANMHKNGDGPIIDQKGIMEQLSKDIAHYISQDNE